MNDDVLMDSPSTQAEIAKKLGNFPHPAVLLSVEKSYNNLAIVTDMTLANAFRKSWSCKPFSRKDMPTYALCHVRGVILKIYSDLVWLPADADYPGKPGNIFSSNYEIWAFYGNETPELNQLIGVDLSEQLTQRGMANPVRYLNC